MTYSQALNALEARRETRIKLGLERVMKVLSLLGDPQDAFLAVHVAGTNGKGSVCAILDSVLRQAGHRTGLYFSPHLWSVRERIQVGGKMISATEFGRAMAAVLRAEKKARVSLTYFELVTCVAFWHFRQKGVRAAVLETGLGGRLDATNVVRRPLACLISSIDFDHMNFLGKTLGQIAREKAGIIKPGRPVICPALAPEAMAEVRRWARALGAPALVVRRPWRVLRVRWRDNVQIIKDPIGREFALGILGACQGLNAALARAAIEAIRPHLAVSERAWRRGLRLVRWPLRFEVRALGQKTVIFDGAHNPEAAKCLAQTWESSPWRGRKGRTQARWILGLMCDKDARGVISALAPHLQDVVLCPPPSPRAMAAFDLAAIIRAAAPKARLSQSSDAAQALRAWRQDKAAPKTALVCGSFYLAAAAAKALGAPGGRYAAGALSAR